MLAFPALAQPIEEYRVKAAFIYNFAKFVEWPPQTFKADKDPFWICVLGLDPFGTALNDAVDGKTVLGRAFAIMEVSSPGQCARCQVLFVSSSERKHLRSILAELPGSGILTVGETNGFSAQGGIINFKLEDGRVRLEINAGAATLANLHISSKVLSLAQVVKTNVEKSSGRVTTP